MKRKLRILVALVMSLTMMFGMSTTAFATTGSGTEIDPYILNISEIQGQITNLASGESSYYKIANDTDKTAYILCRSHNYSYAETWMYIFTSNTGDYANYTDGDHINKQSDCPESCNFGDLIVKYTLEPGEMNWYGSNHFSSVCEGRDIFVKTNDLYGQGNGGNGGSGNGGSGNSGSGNGDDGTPSVPSCDHDFQWQTITSATATTYGTEGDVCSKCGATRNVRTKSPLDDWVRMQINNAKPGDVLKLNFGPWNSYPLWMMQMIADKPTVTYIFNYTYQGNKYEVTIKPGDTVPLDFDWYGPAKMPTLFDTVVTPWERG